MCHFFDFCKVFDKVPHRPLIDKLGNLGLDNHIIQWITSYLTERKQRVVLNGETSEAACVLSGVPQGSVLGPLLFLIYVDGVMNLPISGGSKLVLYADDILLYRPISSQEDYALLQRDIDNIDSWVSDNYLQFNVAKCKYMLISRRRHRVPPPVFTISNLQLEEVESFKYLGLLFTTDLSWTTHITSICAKAKQILGMLYRQFYQQSQPGTLLKLYTSLVRPHLEYASPVWNPYKSKDITMLESVQKFGCKVCTKQWDTGYDQLLQLLDLPTLARRRLYLDLSTMYKIVHGLVYFPPNIFVNRIGRTPNTTRPFLYSCPYAHTNYYQYSFVPRTVSAWNALPLPVVAAELCSFKSNVWVHI